MLSQRERPSYPRDLCSVHQLEREHLDDLFALADELEKAAPSSYARALAGRVVMSLFYQPSTRTRLSFESAALRLGACCSGFSDPKVTRAGDYYQETLEDTIRTIAELSDCIVLRHHADDAPRRAAELSRVPVISAGAGYGEHPTQALGDVYTLARVLGGLDGAVIGLIGDVSIRSLRPISIALSRFRVARLMYLPAPGTSIPDEITTLFAERGIEWCSCEHVDDLLRSADAIETIGVRHPRHDEPRQEGRVEEPTPDRFRITRERLQRVGRNVPILHPGARKDEIATDVDDLPAAIYFQGVRCGLWMRMAVLSRWLGPSAGPFSGAG